MAQVQKGVCILVVYCGCSHLSIGYQPYRQIRAVPVAFPEAMADPSSSSHLHAAASASGGDPRRTQSGAVSDRSRSERGADPDGLATSEHSYAPTSIFQSDAANMDLLMIEPPATSTDLVCLGEPKANETSPPTVPMQAGRLGEPSVTLNAEQKNLLVNAYDQRQVHLHQQAVYVSQDKGPIVASEAREAISELETQAQQRHERAMRDSKREMEDMAQQRLRMAESAIAEQAEEAFKNRVGAITQLQHAEIQEVNKLRTELQSAQVLREEMQLEGAKKMSLYDSRLEKMRNANKRAISGRGREATPAPTRNAAPGVPGAGLCYDFQKGKCTRGDACKYRHEKSKGEEKGKGKGKKGKSRSPSRTRSMSPGSRSEICRFFAAGTCRRGKDCAFKHQKPAAAASSDERKSKKKNKKKSKKDKKGERQASRSSSRGSNPSKGPQSQRSPRGGKPAASSGSAAACLLKAVVMVAAMRPSTSLHCRPEGMALPSSLSSNSHSETDIPKLRFDDNPEVYKHEIDHNAGFVPVLKTPINERKVKKYGQNPPVDKIKIEKITQDSILAAQMLQSAVHRETEGRVSFCNYNCDSDIGCKHCIRSDLRALPGKMPRKPALPTEIAWIADTGSARDLVCETMVHPSSVYESNFPLELTTANGSQSAQKQADVHVGCIDKSIQPYVLPDTPAVVSVGMRCLKDGWDFVWRAFSRPYFRKKNGERIKLEIKDFVPYFANHLMVRFQRLLVFH